MTRDIVSYFLKHGTAGGANRQLAGPGTLSSVMDNGDN